MSLRTVVEVALHFESFRNVDLFHQGLYHLKTRLCREDGDQRLLAIPYGYFACPAQGEQSKQKPSRTDHHHLIPAHIIEDQCTFSTRSFLIRYCEEEVELDDIGQFRIELSSDELNSCTSLILEVDLMFADLTQHGGADRFGEQPDVDSTEFKSVSTQMFRIHSIDQGLHEFCPIVFDEFHFCLANLVIHTVVMDIRLRLKPLDPVLTRPKPPHGKSGENSSGTNTQQPVPAAAARHVALSLAEVLFSGHGGSHERLLQQAEGAYRKHLGALAASHERQVDWFQLICSKCLTPSQRDVFGDAIEAPKLRLPQGLPLHLVRDSPPAEGADQNGHGTLLAHLRARFGPNIDDRALAMHIAYDIDLVACQILEIWNKALNIMSYACREIASLLRMSWEGKIVDQWGVLILRELMTDDVAEPKDKCIGDAHDRAADALRRTEKAPAALIEDMSLIPIMELRPVLFEQRYVPRSFAAGGGNGCPRALPPGNELIPSAPKEYRGVHLFVLVHGFQGNSFDMRLMKNNIALLYPDAIFLCSNSNEANTEGDFSEMGIRLAQEVVNYICDWCPGSALGRLSFIAHSIGGLIVRAALPLLHEYSSKMFTLLTFSTPHVGYFLKNITLFHLGLRVLQSWRQSTCLAQLSMTDSPDPKDTFLYKLSQTRGFEFFQHIVLVSCPSDQYSPFDSARVEIGSMLDKHSNKDAYISMVHNIWEPVKPERVTRFDVNFNLAEKSLDTFIGRAAHIQFLECQPIMKMIIHNYSSLFR